MSYTLSKNSEKSLYEQLYEQIKQDILCGRLSHGEKLPSKRSIAENSGVSLVTVENAYAQLIAEGYVKARERSGYYVHFRGEAFPVNTAKPAAPPVFGERSDIALEKTDDNAFPFTVWARLMRSVILEKGSAILRPVRNGGAEELCTALSDYLYRARGFYVPPEQIIVGSGTEYLYNLLIQLFGRDKCVGVENPGYEKLPKIYELNGVKCEHIELDDEGMSIEALAKSSVDIAHISPAHHYPTGIVMPISRRLAIMNWAEQKSGRYIIEDDYDSEFRWGGKPVPTMFGMDSGGRVVYINTFSLTIAPSVRISYMCLPNELYKLWHKRLGFYSCSVPSFEQYTLARFISEGYFERHINRTKKRYRRVREKVLRLVESFGNAVTTSEENAGLHFTMTIYSEAAVIIPLCESCGLRVTPLSEYYRNPEEAPRGSYIVNYHSADEEKLAKALASRL